MILVKVRGNNHITVQKLTACVKCYGTLWVKTVYSNNKIEGIRIVTDDQENRAQMANVNKTNPQGQERRQ